MADGVYIIPKDLMHEWLLKRCLPQVPAEIGVDLSHGRAILIEELEAMDVWEQFRMGISRSWTNFVRVMDQVSREEDSGSTNTGEGERLRRPSEEEGQSPVSG